MKKNQNVQDGAGLRRYRTEIPNMADDELDPFQYRLYAHYKRVCGADGGECFEAVRTTAEKTRMSNEKVISTRQWLGDNGWIELEKRAKGTFRITIIDCWHKNTVRYSERSNRNTVRNSEQSTRTPLEIPNTPLEISNSTVRNSEQSPLEISNQRSNHYKNEPIKNEPIKNNDHLPGFFLRSLIENAGFVYLDKNFNEVATRLEADYTTEQLIRATEQVKEAHQKKIANGERGITAPLAYMAILLTGGQNGNHAPAKPASKTKERFVVKRADGTTYEVEA